MFNAGVPLARSCWCASGYIRRTPKGSGIHAKFRNNKGHFEYRATSSLQLHGGTCSVNVSSESGLKEGKFLSAKDSLDKMLKDIYPTLGQVSNVGNTNRTATCVYYRCTLMEI